MRAWLFQDSRQKRKLGEKAPWSVGWYDPEGKKRSKRIGSKSNAEKFARKTEGELAAGTYQSRVKKSWKDFRAEWVAKISPSLSSQNREATEQAMDHFERVARPTRMSAIKTQTIDGYVADRSQERGRKKGSTVAAATINKELRHIKAVLGIAVDWGYLTTRPKFRMVKEAQKLVRYVTPDHFAAIYDACKDARYPADAPYPASDWWRALLIFGYMTGWRISEILALRREDLDLAGGEAITRAADNKGKRDESIPLHPIVIEHLERIPSFSPVVFSWPHARKTLWTEFSRIQNDAGVSLSCHEDHEHTDACHSYGFHDLRRAFATENAAQLPAEALQRLMRHKSYLTTQKYINMTRSSKELTGRLAVPNVPRTGSL